MRHPELDTFVAEHEDQLRPLLGELWPVRPFKVEQFGPLTKYTLGQMPTGDWAMLHRLTEPDFGSPHDHPCTMLSTVIQGSYTEKVYQNGTVATITWKAGSTHEIPADYIHTITELPDGEVWSLVMAGPVVREWRHYENLG